MKKALQNPIAVDNSCADVCLKLQIEAPAFPLLRSEGDGFPEKLQRLVEMEEILYQCCSSSTQAQDRAESGSTSRCGDSGCVVGTRAPWTSSVVKECSVLACPLQQSDFIGLNKIVLS